MKKRGFRRKGEFGKKGVAKIIEVILLILIIIIAIFLIWWLIIGFFGEQEEISGLKTKMLVEEMHIDDENILGEGGANSIMLTVTKGPGKQVVTGENLDLPKADIISVVDLSDTMKDQCKDCHYYSCKDTCKDTQLMCVNTCLGSYYESQGTGLCSNCAPAYTKVTASCKTACLTNADACASCGETIMSSCRFCSQENTIEGECLYSFCSKSSSYCSLSFCQGTWDGTKCINCKYCKAECITTGSDSQSVCENCGGTWTYTNCICSKPENIVTSSPYCISTPTNCWLDKDTCESTCGGKWTPSGTPTKNCNGCANENYLYLKETLCDVGLDIQECKTTKHGIWEEKFTTAKKANIDFINGILKVQENKVGLVGYSGDVSKSNTLGLTDLTDSLIGLINSWTLKGGTCICCGINKAVDLLNSGTGNTKAIVVMSDGEANGHCNQQQNTGNAKDDAIAAANEARSKGIIIYAVGFGDEADEYTLKKIADEGKYTKANTFNIVDTYNKIKKTFIFETENFAHLKIMIYDTSGNSCEKKIYETDKPSAENPGLPGPLESRDYSITFGTTCGTNGNEDCDCPDMEKTNVVRIEIYPVLVTKTGTQVIGPALDIWEKSGST